MENELSECDVKLIERKSLKKDDNPILYIQNTLLFCCLCCKALVLVNHFLLVYRKDKLQSAIKIWKYYKFINGLVFLS